MDHPLLCTEGYSLWRQQNHEGLQVAPGTNCHDRIEHPLRYGLCRQHLHAQHEVHLLTHQSSILRQPQKAIHAKLKALLHLTPCQGLRLQRLGQHHESFAMHNA